MTKIIMTFLFLASMVFCLTTLAQSLPNDISDKKRRIEVWVRQVNNFFYPIERVGVVARSVTIPFVLSQGEAILEAKYQNASILCMDIANYSGLVTGLVWSMDRELVEEYGLENLIDEAAAAVFPCSLLFTPPEAFKQQIRQHLADSVEVAVAVGNHNRTVAASPHINEETPAVSIEDIRTIVVPQIQEIQKQIRFAKTLKSADKR
jgi:hypothetical protein